jgi:hypothetical protein
MAQQQSEEAPKLASFGTALTVAVAGALGSLSREFSWMR